jgi:hypothetical protein
MALDPREPQHLHKHIASHYLNRNFAVSEKYDISVLKSHGYFKYPAKVMENENPER